MTFGGESGCRCPRQESPDVWLNHQPTKRIEPAYCKASSAKHKQAN